MPAGSKVTQCSPEQTLYLGAVDSILPPFLPALGAATEPGRPLPFGTTVFPKGHHASQELVVHFHPEGAQ